MGIRDGTKYSGNICDREVVVPASGVTNAHLEDVVGKLYIP